MESLRALGLAGQDSHEEDENVVFYEIYLPQEADAQQAEGLRLQFTEFAAEQSVSRIWQQQRFALRDGRQERAPWWGRQQPTGQPTLWGSTAFGDNVEDEWFIVWLLLELTKRHTDITARVWDNDGEFLLIEAALALPKWLKPDTARNRVWLRGGALHLVPLPSAKHPTLPPASSVAEALAIVAADAVDTLGSPGVQESVHGRVAGFADGTAPPMHRARATLPAALARLLAQEPQLVAPAVDAFYNRDAAAMKAAGRMARFPPGDMVTTSITFNRCLYAQLKQQDFQAPQAYPMPPANSAARPAADLGMKLACGFEMLCAARPASTSQHDTTAPAQPDFGSRSWDAFAAAAQQTPTAEAAAAAPDALRRRFIAITTYEQAAAVQANPVQHIDWLLQEPTSAAALGNPGPEDSDAWLVDSGAELEAELQRRAPGGAAATAAAVSGHEAATPGPEARLDQMSKRMQAFLQETSSYEGADGAATDGVGFDAGGFLKQLGAILGTQGGAAVASESDSDESSGFYDDGGSASSDADSDAGAPAAGGSAAAGRRSGPTAAPAEAQATASASTAAAPAASAVKPGAGAGGWAQDGGPQTDTDSDDAGFMEEYSNALELQLAGTHMGSSFARVSDDPSAPGGPLRDPRPAAQPQPQPPARAAGEDAAAASSAAQPQPAAGPGGPPLRGAAREPAEAGSGAEAGAEATPVPGDGLRPVDLDLNLVSNLLESFASQQGLPGPASNLAGMLGVPLPEAPDTQQAGRR